MMIIPNINIIMNNNINSNNILNGNTNPNNSGNDIQNTTKKVISKINNFPFENV